MFFQPFSIIMLDRFLFSKVGGQLENLMFFCQTKVLMLAWLSFNILMAREARIWTEKLVALKMDRLGDPLVCLKLEDDLLEEFVR